ncbi:MAG: hypothetical protein KKF56_04685 [Nanoarchaeota archaeon]|nr:hypothetical protein [Nanoarchaeota archaeon]
MKKRGRKAPKKQIKKNNDNWKVIAIIVLIILIFILIYLSIIKKDNLPLFSPAINLPSSCSTAEISALWDSIFQISSSDISIISDTTSTIKCNSFIANKTINGDIMYILFGYADNHTTNNTDILAMRINATLTFKTLFKNLAVAINNINPISPFETYINNRISFNNRKIGIIDSANASRNFSATFKITQAPLTKTEEFATLLDTSYKFQTSETETNSIYTELGIVFTNKSYEHYRYTNYSTGVCTPSWQEINNNCTPSETYLKWYNDTNKCPNASGMSSNQTIGCDYDSNGIIGNETTINSSFSLAVYINNERLNLSKVYNTTKIVELKEGALGRVKFSYGFSDPLNLIDLEIDKQPSSSGFGFLIVNGIHISKTVTIDRKTTSNQICLRNAEVTSINHLSSNCTSSNEKKFTCPTTSGGYICNLTTDYFILSGITNSAVKELGGSSSCTPTLICGSWSACSTNNTKTRTCNDTNCGTGQSTESTACTQTCASNWTCTDWRDCVNSRHNRTCTDSNNCLNDKIDQQSCTIDEEKSYLPLIIIIIIVIIVIVIISIVVYFLLRKSTSPKMNYTIKPQQNNQFGSLQPQQR